MVCVAQDTAANWKGPGLVAAAIATTAHACRASASASFAVRGGRISFGRRGNHGKLQSVMLAAATRAGNLSTAIEYQPLKGLSAVVTDVLVNGHGRPRTLRD